MAENTILLPGGGGDTISTDDIGGIKFPRSKITLGADGINDGDVSAANPMPVTGTITVNVGLTDAELRASAVPVSGTVTTVNSGIFAVQASQTGTWTVDLSATDNAAIDLIATNLRQVDLDSSGGTDNWLGVGILFASGLGHVPVSSSNPLPVTISGAVAITDGGNVITVDGTVGISGSVNVTNGGTFVVQVDGTALTRLTDIETNTDSGAVVGNGAAATAQRVTLADDSTGVLATLTNLVQLNGQAIAMGTGIRSAGTQRVTIATDDVVPASQSGTWTVQIGNTPNTTPILTSERPATSGGLSVSSFLSTAAVQATAVKASAGQVYSLSFFNKGAAAVYLRLYNMTTTPGTGDTPIWRAIIPGNTAGAGLVKHFPNGLEFSTGIGFRCTGAIADNDATVLAANEVTGNIEYK